MTAPEPSYTDLAVAIGRLEVGLGNVLDTLKEFKDVLTGQDGRLREVELAQKTLAQRVDALDEKEGRKAPWTAIVALAVAAFAAIVPLFQ